MSVTPPPPPFSSLCFALPCYSRAILLAGSEVTGMQMVFPNLVAQVLLYENFTLQSTSRDYINVLLVLILYYVFEITTYTFNFAFFCLTPFISDGFLIFFVSMNSLSLLPMPRQ